MNLFLLIDGCVVVTLCFSLLALIPFTCLNNTFSFLAVRLGIYPNALVSLDDRIKRHFYQASTRDALMHFLGSEPKASCSMHSLLTITHTHYFFTK